MKYSHTFAALLAATTVLAVQPSDNIQASDVQIVDFPTTPLTTTRENTQVSSSPKPTQYVLFDSDAEVDGHHLKAVMVDGTGVTFFEDASTPTSTSSRRSPFTTCTTYAVNKKAIRAVPTLSSSALVPSSSPQSPTTTFTTCTTYAVNKKAIRAVPTLSSSISLPFSSHRSPITTFTTCTTYAINKKAIRAVPTHSSSASAGHSYVYFESDTIVDGKRAKAVLINDGKDIAFYNETVNSTSLSPGSRSSSTLPHTTTNSAIATDISATGAAASGTVYFDNHKNDHVKAELINHTKLIQVFEGPAPTTTSTSIATRATPDMEREQYASLLLPRGCFPSSSCKVEPKPTTVTSTSTALPNTEPVQSVVTMPLHDGLHAYVFPLPTASVAASEQKRQSAIAVVKGSEAVAGGGQTPAPAAPAVTKA